MTTFKRLICVIVLMALTLTASACSDGSGDVRVTPGTEVTLPVLMYHHLAETGDSSVTISTALFEEHLKWLTDNGWNTVSFDEVLAYVEEGVPLPENPYCIVFDDGYASNYELAFPLLREYNAKATICVIGCDVGLSTYKDTAYPIIPHFGWDEAREMVKSGLISIQHHTYDMHQWAPYETDSARENVLIFEGESEADYTAIFTDDYNRLAKMICDNLGYTSTVFAYPGGRYDALSEQIVRSLGAKVTLTTDYGVSVIRSCEPESVFLLKRCNMNELVDIYALQCALAGVIPEPTEEIQ
ncbi:MAG: polysaccharide deacetylase family protein [Clostridia bacterium]|nr:polysaccharide deacetylase family protein [Clostridia bacterium]